MFYTLQAYLCHKEAPLFEGYRPEASFEHAPEVVIARLTAVGDNAYSAVLLEEGPPRFFRAELRHREMAKMLELSTGSGEEVGRLLHELCSGLANGTLLLDAPADVAWRRKKLFRPQEDGAQAEVFVTSQGLARVDISGRSHLTAATCDLTVFCGSRTRLAMRIAEAASQGMLCARYRAETYAS